MNRTSAGPDGGSGPFLDRGGRPRTLLRLAFQYLTFRVVTYLIVNLLVVGWILARSGGFPAQIEASAFLDSPAVRVVGSVSGLAAALLSVWLAARFLDRRRVRDLGLRLERGWWPDLVFGLILGAALMTGVFGAELVLGWVSVAGTFATPGTGAPFALALLFPAATYLCVGFYEELVSRGYQIRNAAEGMNAAVGPRAAVLLAWVLSSAFFGLLHAQNPNATALSTFNISLAGMMLGLGYVLTGRLAIPIGLHTTWNFFQGAVYGFPVSGLQPFGAAFVSIQQAGPAPWTGGAFGPEAGLISPVAMLAGLLLITLWTRLRTGKLSLHLPLAGETPHNHPKSD